MWPVGLVRDSDSTLVLHNKSLAASSFYSLFHSTLILCFLVKFAYVLHVKATSDKRRVLDASRESQHVCMGGQNLRWFLFMIEVRHQVRGEL